MVSSLLKKYIVYTLILVCVFIAGRYSRPAKVKTVETVKVVTEIKEIETIKEVGVINEKEIRRPDGTVEITKITEYRRDSSRVSNNSTTSTRSRSTETTNLPQHYLGVSYELFGSKEASDYQLTYGYRVFSTFYLTGSTDSKFDSFKLGVTWGF